MLVFYRSGAVRSTPPAPQQSWIDASNVSKAQPQFSQAADGKDVENANASVEEDDANLQPPVLVYFFENVFNLFL